MVTGSLIDWIDRVQATLSRSTWKGPFFIPLWASPYRAKLPRSLYSHHATRLSEGLLTFIGNLRLNLTFQTRPY